jgi:hypothetical protein
MLFLSLGLRARLGVGKGSGLGCTTWLGLGSCAVVHGRVQGGLATGSGKNRLSDVCTV